MALSPNLIRMLLREYLQQAGQAAVRKRMTRALPEILRKMKEKGITPDEANVPVVVRDALFRLWRSVIPSGDVADLVRDSQDEAVIRRVVMKLGGSITDSRDLAIVVRLTLDSLLEVTFGRVEEAAG